MKPKQRVLEALKNQETDRTPWVPFVGCHAAKLIGVDADDYFNSVDYMVKGIERAAERYRPDGLPALFDLQLEAEALGCKLQWAKQNPPAVASHPLAEGKTLADLKIPDETSGRFPLVLDAMKRICDGVGQEVAIYGLITGPFTLALHLMGTDIFYDMIDEPEKVHDVMRFATEVNLKTISMYLETGVDVIAVVDPMTSQISPDSFAEFVTPYLKTIYDDIHEKGSLGTLFVCGNATNNIEEMCRCHADGLSIDENIPLDYVRDICRKHGMSYGGNIKLTVTMLFGTPVDNVNDAMNCVNIGGKKGFILAPGCDMPFDVPPENVEAISAYIHGEMHEFMESSNPLEGVTVELPDYNDPEHVYIDVITLDSSSCAPCQYMMEAIERAAAEFGDKVICKEHRIKDKQGVVAMVELGVQNVPTTVVDSEITFISRIPDETQLKEAMKKALNKKNLL